MKYLVKFIVVTFFLLVCTHTFAEQKIVVLDLKFVLNSSKAGKGAQAFLKKSFIEKILSINISAHEPLIKRKKFLYKLLEKNYPSIKAEQTKLGFSIPLSKWLKQVDFNQPVRSVILNSNFCNSYGFNKKLIEKMLAFHITGQQDFKWPLFSIYSLAIWDRKGRTLA